MYDRCLWGRRPSVRGSALPAEDRARIGSCRGWGSNTGRKRSPPHFWGLGESTGGEHRGRSSDSENGYFALDYVLVPREAEVAARLLLLFAGLVHQLPDDFLLDVLVLEELGCLDRGYS
jgi:hypothetical protein